MFAAISGVAYSGRSSVQARHGVIRCQYAFARFGAPHDPHAAYSSIFVIIHPRHHFLALHCGALKSISITTSISSIVTCLVCSASINLAIWVVCGFFGFRRLVGYVVEFIGTPAAWLFALVHQ